MSSILSSCLMLLRMALGVTDGLSAMISNVCNVIETAIHTNENRAVMENVPGSGFSNPSQLFISTQSQTIEDSSDEQADLVSNLDQSSIITITHMDLDRAKRKCLFRQKSGKNLAATNSPSYVRNSNSFPSTEGTRGVNSSYNSKKSITPKQAATKFPSGVENASCNSFSSIKDSNSIQKQDRHVAVIQKAAKTSKIMRSWQSKTPTPKKSESTSLRIPQSSYEKSPAVSPKLPNPQPNTEKTEVDCKMKRRVDKREEIPSSLRKASKKIPRTKLDLIELSTASDSNVEDPEPSMIFIDNKTDSISSETEMDNIQLNAPSLPRLPPVSNENIGTGLSRKMHSILRNMSSSSTTDNDYSQVLPKSVRSKLENVSIGTKIVDNTPAENLNSYEFPPKIEKSNKLANIFSISSSELKRPEPDPNWSTMCSNFLEYSSDKTDLAVSDNFSENMHFLSECSKKNKPIDFSLNPFVKRIHSDKGAESNLDSVDDLAISLRRFVHKRISRGPFAQTRKEWPSESCLEKASSCTPSSLLPDEPQLEESVKKNELESVIVEQNYQIKDANVKGTDYLSDRIDSDCTGGFGYFSDSKPISKFRSYSKSIKSGFNNIDNLRIIPKMSLQRKKSNDGNKSEDEYSTKQELGSRDKPHVESKTSISIPKLYMTSFEVEDDTETLISAMCLKESDRDEYKTVCVDKFSASAKQLPAKFDSEEKQLHQCERKYSSRTVEESQMQPMKEIPNVRLECSHLALKESEHLAESSPEHLPPREETPITAFHHQPFHLPSIDDFVKENNVLDTMDTGIKQIEMNDNSNKCLQLSPNGESRPFIDSSIKQMPNTSFPVKKHLPNEGNFNEVHEMILECITNAYKTNHPSGVESTNLALDNKVDVDAIIARFQPLLTGSTSNAKDNNTNVVNDSKSKMSLKTMSPVSSLSEELVKLGLSFKKYEENAKQSEGIGTKTAEENQHDTREIFSNKGKFSEFKLQKKYSDKPKSFDTELIDSKDKLTNLQRDINETEENVDHCQKVVMVNKSSTHSRTDNGQTSIETLNLEDKDSDDNSTMVDQDSEDCFDDLSKSFNDLSKSFDECIFILGGDNDNLDGINKYIQGDISKYNKHHGSCNCEVKSMSQKASEINAQCHQNNIDSLGKHEMNLVHKNSDIISVSNGKEGISIMEDEGTDSKVIDSKEMQLEPNVDTGSEHNDCNITNWTFEDCGQVQSAPNAIDGNMESIPKCNIDDIDSRLKKDVKLVNYVNELELMTNCMISGADSILNDCDGNIESGPKDFFKADLLYKSNEQMQLKPKDGEFELKLKDGSSESESTDHGESRSKDCDNGADLGFKESNIDSHLMLEHGSNQINSRYMDSNESIYSEIEGNDSGLKLGQVSDAIDLEMVDDSKKMHFEQNVLEKKCPEENEVQFEDHSTAERCPSPLKITRPFSEGEIALKYSFVCKEINSIQSGSSKNTLLEDLEERKVQISNLQCDISPISKKFLLAFSDNTSLITPKSSDCYMPLVSEESTADQLLDNELPQDVETIEIYSSPISKISTRLMDNDLSIDTR